MTLWEFEQCIDGWNDVHGAKDTPPPAMSDDRLAALEIEGF